MNVTAPSDKRFRRARVKPARQRRIWSGRVRRLARIAAVTGAVAYGGYRATAFVLQAPAFHIDRIVVRGNERLSTGEVQAILHGLRGQSLILADLEGWRQRLRTSPWVRDAAFQRTLPSTIQVVIAERQPMAIGRLGRELYLIDERGTIIDEYGPNYAELDLPIVDGLVGPPRDGGPAIDEARAALVGRLLGRVRVREDLARRISQVDVTDAHDAVVLLDGDTVFVRLGDDRFLERLLSYVELAPALRQRIPDIDYVDLRFDERVYVKPAGRVPRQPAKRPAKALAPQRRS